MHVQHVLEDWAVRTPDASAPFVSGRRPLTYERLHRHIDGVVQRLRALGVGGNGQAALVLPTAPEMAVAFLTAAVGATCAPLNPASSTSELERYLTDLGARALIVSLGTDTPAR